MRRQTLRLTVGIAVLLVSVPFSFSKSYQASRFDVALGIGAGGDLMVTETVDFQFEGGPFTFVFREIPLKESDGLDRFQGFMDGDELRVGAGEMPGLELLQKGNSVRVIWHFQPTSDASHTFVIKYWARGAVRREDGQDLLLWKAIRGDHDYRIESAGITVSYPPGAKLAGQPGANRRMTVRTSGEAIAYDAGRLTNDQGFTVSVPFVQGSILTRPPLWQQAEERRKTELWSAVKIAMAVEGPLFLIGILLIVRLRSGNTVPRAVGPTVVTSPPDDLPPALVGVVRGSWSDWRVALATLIDLGQRGFLEIEAQPKRWWAGREFKLRRKSDAAALSQLEQVLLCLVFGTTQPYAPEVPIRKAQRQVWRRWGEFKRAVREDAQAAGLLDADRESTRRKWIAAGLTMMFLTLTGVAASLLATVPQGRLTPIVVTVAVGLGIFTLGLMVLALGSTSTRLTEAALGRKQAWDAFRKHLKELVSRKGQLHPDSLASFLPYAVVLGLGSQWAKAFKARGMPTHLAWLIGSDQFDGSDIAALIAVLDTSGAGHSTPGGAAGAGGGGGSSGAG